MTGGVTLTIKQKGSRVRLEARRNADGRGLYKVWLTGEPGGRLLLGTLAPEGEELRLSRILSLGKLEQAGCWPVREAEAPLAFPFEREKVWYCEPRPGHLVQDSLLQELLRRPMLCRRTGQGFELAAPFTGDSPIVLNTLLCFARTGEVEGRPHLIWTFDQGGKPVMLGEGSNPIKRK